MRFKVTGSCAQAIDPQVVFLENGAIVLEFEGLRSPNNVLYARIRGKTYSTAIIGNKAKIPRSALQSGVLYCEIVTVCSDGKVNGKIVCTPIEIASVYSQATEPLCAYPQFAEILENMAKLTEEVAALKNEYEAKYAKVIEQQTETLEQLRKIAKSYNLGISLFNIKSEVKENEE